MGETSQKMSENTGEMINKYPASRSLVNHTLLQTKTILGKTEKQIWEQNKTKLGCWNTSEKDVEVILLDGKIEYSEKQRSRLWSKTSQKLSE